MADEKEIILSIKADTSDAASGVDALKTKIGEVNNTPIDKPFKTFKAQIREAISEAKLMEEQFGKNSKQFTEAAKNVANLKDRFGEFNQSIAGFNPDNKLQALVNVAKGATGAIQGVTGAMQFMGDESKATTEAIARLQGLMAFSAALNSVDDIKNGLKDMMNVAKNAFASLSKGDVVGLAIVGIAALGAAIAVLVTDTKKEDVALEVLTKNIDKLKEATASAIEKTNQVKVAFDEARSGVISKDKALKIYNETLGDTFGKATSLNQAEKNYTDKAGAYIKIMGLKAQANALFAASAQEAAKGIVASQEDQTSWVDKLIAGAKEKFIGIGSSTLGVIEAQSKGEKEVKAEAKRKSDLLYKEGENYASQAEVLAKDSNVNLEKIEKAGTDKALDAKKKYLEQLKKFQEDFYKWEIKSQREQAKDLADDADKQRKIDEAEEERQRQIPITNQKNLLDTKKKLAQLNVLDNPDSPEAKINLIKSNLAIELSVLADGDLQKQILAKEAEDAITKIKKEAVDKQTEDAKKAAQEKLSNELDTYQAIGEGLTALGSLFGKQTVKAKALNTAGAIMNTAVGITQIWSNKTTIPEPFGTIQKVASTVIAAASGLKAVQTILATPIEGAGGSAGSAPAMSSLAPVISAASTVPQNIQDVRVTNNNQAPIRAYITNSDLQNNETKNRFLNSISTF